MARCANLRQPLIGRRSPVCAAPVAGLLQAEDLMLEFLIDCACAEIENAPPPRPPSPPPLSAAERAFAAEMALLAQQQAAATAAAKAAKALKPPTTSKFRWWNSAEAQVEAEMKARPPSCAPHPPCRRLAQR